MATPSAAAGRAAPHNLGQKTARGALWLMAQAVVQKGLAIATGIVLAWLLAPEVFGLVGMTVTVTMFAKFVQQAGMRDVLVQRQQHFQIWATPAFWMSLSISAVMATLVVVTAPLVARFYGEAALTGLLYVSAVNLPIVALANVPEARLRSQLRFRFLTLMGMAMTLATAILMIAMAWIGLGAYSFVLPLPILNAVRAAIYWSAAGVRIRREPQWRRWRFLVADSLYITVATIGLVVIAQADMVVVGRVTSVADAGFYYFAIRLSMQTVRLVAMNLASVLFPALSHLQVNPAHQVGTFLRATRGIAILSIPICLLQAVLADPLVRLLFPERWYPAITLLEVLSVAMAFRSLSFLASSLQQARGRFAARCAVAVGGAVVFTAIVCVMASQFGTLGVAIGVLIFHAAFVLVMVSMAIIPVTGLMGKLWQTVVNPFMLSLASVGTARGLVWLLPATLQSPLPVILLTTLLVVVIHASLIWWLMPQTWSEIGARVGQVVRRSDVQ